jgi:hypothetical protein
MAFERGHGTNIGYISTCNHYRYRSSVGVSSSKDFDTMEITKPFSYTADG